jgi:hypothetical protein
MDWLTDDVNDKVPPPGGGGEWDDNMDDTGESPGGGGGEWDGNMDDTGESPGGGEGEWDDNMDMGEPPGMGGGGDGKGDLVDNPDADAAAAFGLGAFVGIGAGGLVVLLLIIYCCCTSRNPTKPAAGSGAGDVLAMRTLNNHKSRPSGDDPYQDPTTYADPTILHALIREWACEIAPSDLRLGKVIGKGEFGKVHQTLWMCSPTPVKCAGKTMTATGSKGAMLSFLKEAAIMGQFNHVNVIQLIGVVLEGPAPIIVIELMLNGALSSYLMKNVRCGVFKQNAPLEECCWDSRCSWG